MNGISEMLRGARDAKDRVARTYAADAAPAWFNVLVTGLQLTGLLYTLGAIAGLIAGMHIASRFMLEHSPLIFALYMSPIVATVFSRQAALMLVTINELKQHRSPALPIVR